MSQAPQPVQPQQIQIKDGFAGGEYSNAMQVSHSKEEFLLTFLNIAPPNGRVVGKIMTSPGHLKQIINALQDNMSKYEAQFGQVTAAVQPKNEIGFKAE